MKHYNISGALASDVGGARTNSVTNPNIGSDADNATGSKAVVETDVAEMLVESIHDVDATSTSAIFAVPVSLFTGAKDRVARKGMLDRSMFDEPREIGPELDARGRLAGKDGPAFVGGVYVEGLRGTSVSERTIVTLDLDDVDDANLDAFVARLDDAGLERLIYTSVSHGLPAKGGRYRLLLAPSRALTAMEYPRLVRALIDQLDTPGVDGASLSAAQLMYLPTKVRGTDHYRWKHTPGGTVDVDTLLACAEGDEREERPADRSKAGIPIESPEGCLALLTEFGGDPDDSEDWLAGAMRVQAEAGRVPAEDHQAYIDAFVEWSATAKHPKPDGMFYTRLESVVETRPGQAPKTFADLIVKRREREQRDAVQASTEAREHHAQGFAGASERRALDLAAKGVSRDESLDQADREELVDLYRGRFLELEGKKVSVAVVRKRLALEQSLEDEGPVVSMPRRFVDELVGRDDVEITQNQHGEPMIRVGAYGQRTAVSLVGGGFTGFVSRWLYRNDPSRTYSEREIKETVGTLFNVIGLGADGADEEVPPELPVVATYARHGFARTPGTTELRRYTYLGGPEKRIVEHLPGREPRLVGRDEDIGFKFTDGGAELSMPTSVPDEALVVGGRVDGSGRVLEAGTLGPAVERLFWHLVAVPEAMRMVVLGRIVHAWMAENRKQPVVIFSDAKGTTGKSPTIARLRELIDPTGNLSLGSLESPNLMTRQKIGRWVTAINEVEDLPKDRQTRFKGNADGDTETLPVFYVADGTVDIDAAGPKFIATNRPVDQLVSVPTLRSRTIGIEPDELTAERRVDDLVADAAFEDEFPALVSTICALLSRVLEVMPEVTPRGGFPKMPAVERVVDAVHRVLRQPGSMAETLAGGDEDALYARFESHEFLGDVRDEVIRQGGTWTVSARFALDTVTATQSEPERHRRRVPGQGQSDAARYPTSSSEAKVQLSLVDVAAAGGLIVENGPTRADGKRVKDAGGVLLRLTLNGDAPSSAEIPMRPTDIVPSGPTAPSSPGAGTPSVDDPAAQAFRLELHALTQGDDMAFEALRGHLSRRGYDGPLDVPAAERDGVRDAVIAAMEI